MMPTEPQDAARELESLLSEEPTAAERRAASAFDRLAGSARERIVIFGAGNLGAKVLRGLRAAGVEPLAMSDNNPARHGTRLDGVEILAPDEAVSRFGAEAVFVLSIWNPFHRYLSTEAQLRHLGAERVVPFQTLMWKYPNALLPHFFFELPHRLLQHRDEIARSFSLLEDAESQRQFVAQLRWRLHLDYAALPLPSPQDQYFISQIRPDPDEIVFDCGAFDGDTVQQFLDLRGTEFRGYVAFEPDAGTFGRLHERVARMRPDVASRIRAVNAAVGRQSGTMAFDAAGQMHSSLSTTGSTVVRVVALDDDPRCVAPAASSAAASPSQRSASTTARTICGAFPSSSPR
jgi:hypothetical protein